MDPREPVPQHLQKIFLKYNLARGNDVRSFAERDDIEVVEFHEESEIFPALTDLIGEEADPNPESKDGASPQPLRRPTPEPEHLDPPAYKPHSNPESRKFFDRRKHRGLGDGLLKMGRTHMEAAKELARLKRENNLTVQQLADTTGINVTTVYQHLKLLELVPEVSGMINPKLSGEESLAFLPAVEVAKLPSEQQVAAAKHIISQKMTVPKARDYIRLQIAQSEEKKAA